MLNIDLTNQIKSSTKSLTATVNRQTRWLLENIQLGIKSSGKLLENVHLSIASLINGETNVGLHYWKALPTIMTDLLNVQTIKIRKFVRDQTRALGFRFDDIKSVGKDREKERAKTVASLISDQNTLMQNENKNVIVNVARELKEHTDHVKDLMSDQTASLARDVTITRYHLVRKEHEFNEANEVRLKDHFTELYSMLNANFSEAFSLINDSKNESDSLENIEWRLVYHTRTSCRDVLSLDDVNATWDGRGASYSIYPRALQGKRLDVYCDTTTDGGGWLVIQRRVDGSVNFTRSWDDYVNGFGDRTHEFWLGLNTLYELTTADKYELRIELKDWEGNSKYAKYGEFSVGHAASNYLLTVGSYTGSAGDSMTYHNGAPFSTIDADNDAHAGDCANLYKGGWWYKKCHAANLNGRYFVNNAAIYGVGISWLQWHGHNYSMKWTEMKMRFAN